MSLHPIERSTIIEWTVIYCGTAAFWTALVAFIAWLLS